MPMVGAIAGAATSLVGGLMGAQGAASAGANAEAEGKYEQEQYEQEAYTSVARAQRKMEETQHKGQLVQSTLQARGAGAGLSTGVGSVSQLSQQIAGRTTYSALSDLAAGQDQAAGYFNQGAAAKYRGDLALSQVPGEEFGSIAGAASSAFGSLGKAAASGSYG